MNSLISSDSNQMIQSDGIFVEEINFEDILLAEIVGKGTFGVVKRGIWRGKQVAVKIIETEQERQAFRVELRQLSRVSHPNIVKLYGATSSPNDALVMEYAEGGSLYNVLHLNHSVSYTLSHAISWVLQCARGVSYLHNMKPKPLVHRDLKPLNLLLVNSGRDLKICDFGTACDVHTHMSNNKGSAAWMAPEVFEGSNYSEKCDIFSWGIILWEVLARKKPFDECGGPAFRIMWAVHNGTRPPLLQNCPKEIESLMTKCWSKNSNERPSMAEIEEQISYFFRFCGNHHLEPIVCNTEMSRSGDKTLGTTMSSFDQQMQTQINVPQHIVTEPPVYTSSTNDDQNTKFFLKNDSALSVPPNLSGLISVPSINTNKSVIKSVITSAQLIQPILLPIINEESDSATGSSSNTNVRTHKRSSSSGAQLVASSSSQTLNKSKSFISIPDPTPLPSTSRDNTPSNFIRYDTSQNPNLNYSKKHSWPTERESRSLESSEDFNAYLVLEPKLQPLYPDPSDPESRKIFLQHRKLSQEYLRMQMEVTLLLERKEEINKRRTENKTFSDAINDYWNIKGDNDGLVQLRDNLIRQRDTLKRRQRQREAAADGDWVLID